MLDIDNKDSWRRVFLDGMFVLAPKRRWIELSQEEKIVWNGAERVFDYIEELDKKLFDNLVSMCDKIIANEYKYIVGYHGTAKLPEWDYSKNGICLSNIAELRKVAIRIFADEKRVDKAICDIGDRYSIRNHGKIYFGVSRTQFRPGNFHYLQGSGFLQAIANRLEGEARNILESRSEPTLIRFRVETKKCDFWTLRSFALRPVIGIFAEWMSQENYEIAGSGIIDFEVPPEDILEIEQNPIF